MQRIAPEYSVSSRVLGLIRCVAKMAGQMHPARQAYVEEVHEVRTTETTYESFAPYSHTMSEHARRLELLAQAMGELGI